MLTRKAYVVDGLTLFWVILYPNNDLYVDRYTNEPKCGIAYVYRDREAMISDFMRNKLHEEFDVYCDPAQWRGA